MKFQAVKGTRDFYPDDMRLRNYIVDAWRRVSLRNGFEEYDAPIFEYLDLFTVKSGEEIAEQLFSFTDRGGRRLAIRPEITPSLARMVAAKINSLPRPIKWFSIPRLCRAERPQRGRLREFFQWNIDIIGVDDVQADAECIYCLVDFLREVNLSPEDVCVRIGSRPLMVEALKMGGVPDAKIDSALVLLDKRPRLSDEELSKLIAAAGLVVENLSMAYRLQDCNDIDQVRSCLDSGKGVADDINSLKQLLMLLGKMGLEEYCRLDMSIVRGLAYYTGIVYEVFDGKQSLRAIAGGGRYDNLLQLVGGPAVPATGFGMGDVVLRILLEEKGKIADDILLGSLDFFVVAETKEDFDTALQVVAALRAKGIAADYSFKRQAIGKQLKEANRRGAKKAAILQDGAVAVKDLTTGEQAQPVTMAQFLKTAGG